MCLSVVLCILKKQKEKMKSIDGGFDRSMMPCRAVPPGHFYFGAGVALEEEREKSASFRPNLFIERERERERERELTPECVSKYIYHMFF